MLIAKDCDTNALYFKKVTDPTKEASGGKKYNAFELKKAHKFGSYPFTGSEADPYPIKKPVKATV